jgi:hypothetical protein
MMETSNSSKHRNKPIEFRYIAALDFITCNAKIKHQKVAAGRIATHCQRSIVTSSNPHPVSRGSILRVLPDSNPAWPNLFGAVIVSVGMARIKLDQE